MKEQEIKQTTQIQEAQTEKKGSEPITVFTKPQQAIPEDVKKINGIGVVHEDFIPIKPLTAKSRKPW